MIFALQLLPSSDGIPAQAREPYWEVSIPVFRERPETTRQGKRWLPHQKLFSLIPSYRHLCSPSPSTEFGFYARGENTTIIDCLVAVLSSLKGGGRITSEGRVAE